MYYSQILKYIQGNDPHYNKLLQHFGPSFLKPHRAEPIIEETYIILFTNRSGSNLLTYLLSSSGWINNAMEEILDHNVIIRISAENTHRFYSEYLQDLIERQAVASRFAMKASLGQLLTLFVTNIHKILGNIRILMIERDHKLSQAVSWDIATQTQKWTSKHQGVETVPVMNRENISKFLRNVMEIELASKIWLESVNIPHSIIQYEKLIYRPIAELDFAFAELGLEKPPIDLAKVGIKKQASDINQEYLREIFREIPYRSNVS